jgi:hypothetical protein
VAWVVTPDPFPDSTNPIVRRIARFNWIYASLGVPMVDWRAAVEPDGVWTPTVTLPSGPVQVRSGDALHLSDVGSRLVADATWRALARWFPEVPAG